MGRFYVYRQIGNRKVNLEHENPYNCLDLNHLRIIEGMAPASFRKDVSRNQLPPQDIAAVEDDALHADPSGALDIGGQVVDV